MRIQLPKAAEWWGEISAGTGVGWKKNWALQSCPFHMTNQLDAGYKFFGVSVLHAAFDLYNNLFLPVC